MERDQQSETGQDSSFGGWLWIILFATFALIMPHKPAAAASDSYVVEEIVEIISYDIVEPEMLPVQDLPSLGQFGPFKVISPYQVHMSGTVDSDTPGQFAAMLRQYPQIRQIEMINCSGSLDEDANLRLARQIRQAGINTHVPAHGSVRSGAVELFLSGIRHTADPGAEFVVHSWIDEDGMEASDYPVNDPVHAEYLDYYAEMGVPRDKARAFYDLTNSVPFAEQLKLTSSDLARYQLLH
ncbi:MAG: alpha/beta hydrolase [Pseudomonadota bacterium]